MALQARHYKKYNRASSDEACEIPSNMASEHLRLMEARGLISGERRGRPAYYKKREPYLASEHHGLHRKPLWARAGQMNAINRLSIAPVSGTNIAMDLIGTWQGAGS